VKSKLKLPAALAVLMLGSTNACSTPPVADASSGDSIADTTLETGVDAMLADADDSAIDVGTDACPDPFKCYSDFVVDDAGQVHTVYFRRDGGISTTPCPPVPPGCPVA
jgi:hypothetical protein